ncbi:hypothetical protein GGQ64_002568 [Rhizobium azooxidifex]|uniref:Tip attachment protein J domain-containing protein n=1 Tax=Mycoplana azooxidifex TaxID=1636188 RepID=A0A7W6D7A6_9HYPH|nr:phage tail protein [Mycoplana azooxidifex]MBB3977362.1 hypothetical protein [Mycoplana azooxidifex]
MKFLVLLLAAWFVLAMPSAAHADPITALVTAIASAIGGLGAFGQAIFGLALKIGASLLAKAMTKEPDPVGVRGQIEVGGDNPISFIVGTYATTGQLEYVGTFGTAGKTPNAYLTQVISLGDLPVNGLVDLFVNGEKCTIDYDETKYGDWGFPVTDFEDDGDNALWIKFYDGTQTTADPLLIAEFGDHPERPWTSDMLGRGVPYAIVTAQFKRDVLTGPPRCTFVVEGIKLYDPRKDTTAGGSGAHRWGDRSTYEWSDNPKVIQYNVMRGIYYGGEWVYGGQGMRAFQLPVSSWFAAMNECDRLVPIKAGGTEMNFRCGFEVKGDLEPIELCQKLDRACNGKTAENGGIYKTVSGNPGMPVYYFTDENLIVSEPQSFNPFPGLEKVYNGAHASYPEPDEAWAAKDAPPRYRADLEEEDDGRRLIANLTYEAVPYKRQVQRLMRAALEANRRFRSHQGVFAPAAKLLEPLDVISWTSARNGYDNKRFQLGAIDDLSNVNQSAAFSELDPADYDWSTDYELPDSVGPIGRVKPQPQVLTGFGVFPDTVKDANGNDRRPAILLVWPWNAEDVAIRAIAFQVRRADDEKKVFVGRFDQPEDGQVLLAPFSLVGNEDYEVRAKFITNSNTELFAWSTWQPVTTPDVQFIAEDILDGAVVASKIADAAITAAKLMDGAVEELKIADRAISTIKVKLSAIKTELVDNAAIVQSKIANAAIGDAQLAALAVTAGKIANNAVTTTTIADDAITTPKIVASAIVGDKVAANAITAGKILVSDTTDVVMNGQFAGGSGDGWSGSGFAGVVPGSNRSGKSPYIGTLAVDASNQSANFTLNVPTKEGDEYYVSMDVAGGGSPPTLNAQLQVAWNDESGSQLSTSNIVAPSTGAGWITAAGIVVAPAGAAAIRRLTVIRLGTSTGQFAFFTNVSMRKRNTAELIVDGAIIADKLATNSVTTSKIVAGAVTATEIGAEAVTTVKLAAEAVVAAKIAANTITSDKMVANSITARELLLVDFENVIPNGFFGTAVGTLDGWDTISTNISVVQGTSRSPAPSPFIARYEATATLDLMATSRTIQCSPGDKFHAQFDYAGSGGSIAGTFQLLMNFRDAAGASIGNGTVSATISSTGWATASGEITAPAGTVTIGFVQMRRAAGSTGDGAAFVANLLIRRKKNSELIVDGAIIADKLATNSVITSKIAALAITAAKIATRVITADKLILGGVTYEEIGNNEVTVTATAYTNSITTISVTNSWAGIGSVTLAHGNTGGKVLLKGICTHSADIPKLQGDFPLVDMRFVDSNTGNIIETFTNIYPYGTCQIYSAWSPPSGRTSTTFNCQIRIASARTTTLDFDFRNRFVEATALRR